jgi:hypothetical protein
MVYAPRTEKEVETVRRIVAAAAWWVGGVDVDEKFGEDAEGSISESENGDQIIDGSTGQTCKPSFMQRATS